MNNKQSRVLAAVFEEPTCATLEWARIENMLSGIGAQIENRKGSRIRVTLNGVRASFHRPHPETTAGRGRVEAVREFLEKAGVGP